MIKIAFAGFRHGHINSLYRLAEKNPDVEMQQLLKQILMRGLLQRQI